MTKSTLKALVAGLAGFVTILAFAAYRTTETAEIGYPGVGMQVTDSEDRLEAKLAMNEMPAPLPAAATEGPLAVDAYENVQVLGHLTAAQFTRLMTAITLWVSPEQGCAYCHNTENMASDEVYAKHVSRRMIQMTMNVNENWQRHVQQTGVTCYTCHRGNPVPQYIWFEEAEGQMTGMLGYAAEQNAPAAQAGLASLPATALQSFLLDDQNIRVQSGEPLPNGNRSSIKQTEWTYSLMMHMSQSLGVNCTYCHNSRSWADWSQSPTQRASAWHGIRMVRELNNEYLVPLKPVYPEYRLGPLGDAPKSNCATCHQGAYRPLLGAPMLEDYPSLSHAVVPQPEKSPVFEIEIREDRVDFTDEIQFASGSAEILEDSHALLDALAKAIREGAEADVVRVVGHTDVTGEADANLQLSQQRAAAVVAYLIDAGVGDVTLSAIGRGETEPLCAEGDADCDARNRRVELLFGPAPVEGEEGAEGATEAEAAE